MLDWDADCVIVGAGVVGLACGRALALAGMVPVLVEAQAAIGTGISSRNSGVIHAGIYYPTASLKQILCVAGRRALYAFCEARQIPHRRTGKLILAADDAQVGELESLFKRAKAQDVEGLHWLDQAQLLKIEPALSGKAAIFSRETGIIDAQALMHSLWAEIDDHGGILSRKTPFLRAETLASGGFRVHLGGTEPCTIRTPILINSAGLHAQKVAHQIEGLAPARIPPLFLAKGSYFTMHKQAPFAHLVYPMPQIGGLGIHATLDLAGGVRFGPDVEWLDHDDPDRIDYSVKSGGNSGRLAAFEQAIRQYWPGLPTNYLHADQAGCRPKLAPGSTAFSDFAIQHQRDHGIPGLVNLFGIESPGLTSALAIGEHVALQVAGG